MEIYTISLTPPNELFALLDKLLNINKWPTYTNSQNLSELEKIANEAFERDSFDGYLSYVLISHQVCEDYAILLLRHTQFALRLNVLPNGFGWPSAKYEQPGVRENQMFGRILQMIEKSLEFNCKHEFIAACSKQSRIRNRLAHSLIEGITLQEIRDLAHEYKEGDEDVVHYFNEGDESFSWFYYEQILHPKWDVLLSTQINSAEDKNEKKKWESLQIRLERERENTPINFED